MSQSKSPSFESLAGGKCRNGAPRLDAAEITLFLACLPAWTVSDEILMRRFKFVDFGSALAFATQVGAIAEAQNHHPDLRVGWGYCEVAYTTHDAGGLTANDFVCAARTERLWQR